MAIPKEIERSHILAAKKRLDEGELERFARSTTYDVVIDGQTYPPKALISIAAELATGVSLPVTSFSGGASSGATNPLLKRLGFEVVKKTVPMWVAAYWILMEERPLHGDDMVSRMLDRGWFSTHGKTPGDTLQTQLMYRCDSYRGRRLSEHFRRAGPNIWTLTEWGEVNPPNQKPDGNESPVERNSRFEYLMWILARLASKPCSTPEEVRRAVSDAVSLLVEERGFTKNNYSECFEKRQTGVGRSEFYRYVLQAKLGKAQGLRSLLGTSPGYGHLVGTKRWVKLDEVLQELEREGEPEGVNVPTGTESSAYSLDDLMEHAFASKEEMAAILASLKRKKNVVLQGPPGVGKSYLARRIAYALMGVKDPSRVAMVQFHQSFSYEDFIQGWRPTEGGGFELKDGVFYSFCKAAAADPSDRPWVFIIDEINRGNLSKIFGELMLLIEADKRHERIPLTYASSHEDRFHVPSKVHLLGMMNTADRSLAMVDYALRRRFVFHDLAPQFGSSTFRSHLLRQGVEDAVISCIKKRVQNLNEAISSDSNLGAGFSVGHSFFCPSSQGTYGDDWYSDIVRNEIGPLLREYWFDNERTAQDHIDALLSS